MRLDAPAPRALLSFSSRDYSSSSERDTVLRKLRGPETPIPSVVCTSAHKQPRSGERTHPEPRSESRIIIPRAPPHGHAVLVEKVIAGAKTISQRDVHEPRVLCSITHRSRFAGSRRIAATTPRRANRSCAFFTPLFLSGLLCGVARQRHARKTCVRGREGGGTHCNCRLFFRYALEISCVDADGDMSSHE